MEMCNIAEENVKNSKAFLVLLFPLWGSYAEFSQTLQPARCDGMEVVKSTFSYCA